MEASKKKNIAIGVMAIVVIVLGILTFITTRELDRVRDQLTAKDAQIQKLDTELDLSESTLLTVSQLNKKYEEEIVGFPAKLRGIIDEYNLKLQSRDATIAALRNQIHGGHTEVEVHEPPPGTDPGSSPQAISYKWTDNLDRFHLVDPDIFTPNNEEFSYNQYIAVKGHVFYGKDGKLQIRRVELHEVVPDGKDASGKPVFKEVPGGKLEVVDSTFEYADLGTKERRLWDIIHPRLIASLDSQLALTEPHFAIHPGVGVEWVNLGRYIDHANVGLNTKVALNLDDIGGGSLLKSRIGLGVDYTLLPPLINTNIGLGIGVSTPSNNLLNDWALSIDAVFYLTN